MPCRSVFSPCSTQVWRGPDGPVRVALADVTAPGISANRGSPAGVPVQPQKSSGFGDSVMK